MQVNVSKWSEGNIQVKEMPNSFLDQWQDFLIGVGSKSSNQIFGWRIVEIPRTVTLLIPVPVWSASDMQHQHLRDEHTLGAHGDKAPLNAKKDQMWPFLLGISPQFTGVISSCVAKPTSPGVAANTPTHDSALIMWGCGIICHNTMHSRILCIVYKYYAYHVFPWYSIIPFLW